MCEPLDYYSARSGNKTMNNVTSIDLEYNFNNLRNMILFNHAKLLEAADKRPIEGALSVYNKEYKKYEPDYLSTMIEKNLESIFDIEIAEAHLELDIATHKSLPPCLLSQTMWSTGDMKQNRKVLLH